MFQVQAIPGIVSQSSAISLAFLISHLNIFPRIMLELEKGMIVKYNSLFKMNI